MFTFSQKNQNHGESVYNLVGQSERERRRQIYPDVYVSRYACKVRKEACCRKSGAYKTMGTPSVFVNQPHKFLKKFSGGDPCFWQNKETTPLKLKSCLVKNSSVCSCCCKPNVPQDSTPRAKPSQSERCHNINNRNFSYELMTKMRGSHSQPLLSRNVSCQTEDAATMRNYKGQGGDGDCVIEEDDCAKFGEELRCTCEKDDVPQRVPLSYNGNLVFIERGQKDFIRDNALAAMRTPPKIPERRIVDGYKGHRNEWVPPQLLGKVGFGQVPQYIGRVKQELYQRDLEMKSEMEKATRNKCRALTEEERRMILKGLDLHWKEIFSEYQTLPLYSLSPKLEKKKVELEARLKRVEKDIQLFNRNGPLFVADVIRSHYL